jgi:hypothetical protein
MQMIWLQGGRAIAGNKISLGLMAETDLYENMIYMHPDAQYTEMRLHR